MQIITNGFDEIRFVEALDADLEIRRMIEDTEKDILLGKLYTSEELTMQSSMIQ